MTTEIKLSGHALDEKGKLIQRPLGTAESLQEARELAEAFLLDPRDTIQVVYFYDVRRQQFTGWLNRSALTKGPRA